MSTLVKGQNGRVIEQDCTITLQGRDFTAGGAWLGTHKTTGKLGGILYAYEDDSEVGDWGGNMRIKASFS